MQLDRRPRLCRVGLLAKRCSELAQHTDDCSSLCTESVRRATNAANLLPHNSPASCSSSTAATHRLMADVSSCVSSCTQTLAVVGALIAPSILAFASELLVRHQQHLQGQAPPMPQEQRQVVSRVFALFGSLLACAQASAAAQNVKARKLQKAVDEHTMSAPKKLDSLTQQVSAHVQASRAHDNDCGKSSKHAAAGAGGAVVLGVGTACLIAEAAVVAVAATGVGAIAAAGFCVGSALYAHDSAKKSQDAAARACQQQRSHDAQHNALLTFTTHHKAALAELLAPVGPTSDAHNHGGAVMPKQLLCLLMQLQEIHNSVCDLRPAAAKVTSARSASNVTLQAMDATARSIALGPAPAAEGTASSSTSNGMPQAANNIRSYSQVVTAGHAASDASRAGMSVLLDSLEDSLEQLSELRQFVWPDVKAAAIGAAAACGITADSSLLQAFLEQNSKMLGFDLGAQPGAVLQLLQGMRRAEAQGSVLEGLMTDVQRLMPAQQQGQNLNPSNNTQITPALADSISSLSFSPAANVLVATCWDNSAYCWRVGDPPPRSNSSYTATPLTSTSTSAPLLCSAFLPDGSGAFIGGTDKAVRLWDLSTNQTRQVAAHDAPIKHCAYVPQCNLLITGSWDKPVKYWDIRSPTPAAEAKLPDRVHAMDVKNPMLVVGCADKNFYMYDLKNPSKPYATRPSPLKLQTRCVSVFPDRSGYVVGSVEGRAAVVDLKTPSKDFTFKCHREDLKGAYGVPYIEAYAVNDIKFHPRHETLVTTGGDGGYSFWDKNSKLRLLSMPQAKYAPNLPASIPCCAYNADGNIFAYAVSYDWSRGYQGYDPKTMPSHIFLHQVRHDKVAPRAKASAGAAAGPSRR